MPLSRATTGVSLGELGEAAMRPLRRRSRRLQGRAPPQAGIRAAGFRSCGILLADQRKCTESVSPSSNSPDRPSPKRLPGGRAFNLRRSVLGALGNLVHHSATVKHVEARLSQTPIKSSIAENSRRSTVRDRDSTQKCTEAGAPSSGFPTDLRRSDCLSESHQPRALLPRCNQDTTGSRRPRQASVKCNFRSLRIFLYNPHILASNAVCST